uniref:Interferon lambda 4 (gene/pseudogene) n=1 Tax=Chlorocebus sabaeus TaxID=60711 RepID=A0A0D9QV69_CHLSB
RAECVWAAVAAGLWVLCTVGAATPRRCLLSRYRSLEPRTQAAVKGLRVRYEEEALSWRPRNCSFPRRDPPRPSTPARLRHVARSIAEAQAAPRRPRKNRSRPGSGPLGVHKSRLGSAAGRATGRCLELARPGSSRKVPRAPRRRHKPRKADSPRCREVTVVFNLLRLLTWELMHASSWGTCL